MRERERRARRRRPAARCSGGDTDQTREARAFADAPAPSAVAVPVELYDERFTTAIAARAGGARTSEDSRAAAVLLEDWLARHAGEAAR